ncbi:uncharacterized protein A4U43_C01F21420 [Asparagus officinalis]|uniref:Uncharacterized protein n=1 Tax=Asparagus officinalis TaxID=4686 RepID=A0A5P1FRB1_ASPOF|nr:uncharacterized protein A4U43_C01F21420 [Asparagus officinalis]
MRPRFWSITRIISAAGNEEEQAWAEIEEFAVYWSYVLSEDGEMGISHLEGSDSEHESNDVARTSRRPQKRARGKYRLMSKGPDGPCPDLLQLQSTSSSYACMSLLKRKRSGGAKDDRNVAYCVRFS